MSEQTIRRALGTLQDDAEHAEAWAQLQDAVLDPAAAGMDSTAFLELLEAARHEHAARQEYEAVARLLELEILLADGSPREVELQAELVRVLNEVLDDTRRSIPALERLAKLCPDDERISKKIAAIKDEKARWPELLQEMMDAAERLEGNPQAQAGILYTAAQTAYRYGLEGTPEEITATRQVIIERLEEALELAPDRRETALLLERLYRAEGDWEKAARVLEKIAVEAPDKETRLAAWIRLARTASRKLNDEARAARAYERVLELSPGQDEAMRFLVDHFSKNEQWDFLVAVYEDALKARLRPGKETEIHFQIAMINWRMRGKPDAAEPYFEKIRRAEPAHPAMLAFFREYLPERNEQSRLVQILTEAQRAMPDGQDRASIAAELAKLSEETQGAGKAIEHWRSVLRNEPTNAEARESLKRLYYRTEAWPALIDLLRQQLDRLPAQDPARVPILKEIAALHRDKTKQDAALVPILNQIVQLDPTDVDAVREQVRIYEALNRPRDLVTAQTRLAELETNAANKAELWRAVARQWLEKFSNIQNAVEAYEKLLEQVDGDEEATAKLRELYAKRRAFKPLYELLAKMRARATGDEKRELTLEMAKLAADRLDKGAEAIELYWSILEDDPRAPGVLDALEKQAERDKDFAALARVLSFRVDQTEDVDAKIKLLEKLGGIYETRVKDSAKTIETWRRVLELRPGYPKALRNLREEYLAAEDFDGLTEVYASQEDWEGLADALSGAADKATDPAQRIALSWRVADVYVDKIKRPERAARSYERILATAAAAAPSSESGAERAYTADELRAAKALVPILEAESSWARLPQVYEILLAGETDTREKVRILGRLRELASGPLADRAGAFKFAREAYALAPTEDARVELEAAARAASAWEPYVDALRERLARLSNAKKLEKLEERRRLQREVARVLAAELHRVDDAVAQLRKVVDADEEDTESVAALDSLLRENRRADDLRGLYELRLGRAGSRDEQVALLVEWAQLEEDAFADPARALTLYERALELSPEDRTSLRAVARLRLAAGDAAGAASALERVRDLAVGTERAEREIELARLYVGALAKPEAALEAAVRALAIASHEPSAIAVLEQLVSHPELGREAARHLEAEYEATGAFDKQTEAIELLLQGTTDRAERRELLSRLAAVHREQRGDAAAAFAVMLRATSELPDDLELWDRLAELGGQTGELRKVAEAYEGAITGDAKLTPEIDRELCERASILLEDKLSDPDAAIPYLVRILDVDPADAHAFNRLKQILTARERWDDLQKMYDRAVASASDPVRRVDLLSEMALVFEDILDDPARAAAAYERVIEIDPDHETANRALDKLYARTSRWSELAALLSARLDRVSAEQRSVLEERLARLYLDQLERPDAALKHAASLLEAEIDHTDARAIARAVMERPNVDRATRVRAAEVLEQVYLARDEARELDEVTAIRLAETPDLAVEDRVELLRRAARLRDERLANDAGALDALAELVPLDPEDEDARRKLLEVGRRAGAHARVAEVLGRAAENARDPALAADVLVEQARVFEDLLADDAQAERVYRRILDLKDESGEPLATQRGPALLALERIYEARGQHDRLAEILALRVEHDPDPVSQRTLLGRLGALREGPLADREGAIAAWRRRLDADDADLEALEALDRLYTATERHRELVEVLRARERLADDPELRREALRRSAEVLAGPLGDVQGAIDAYRTLLDDFGPDRAVLAALGALHEKAGAHRDLEETILRQLDLATEPAEQVELYARLGKLRIEHLSELEAGLEAYREALVRDASHAPTREALEALLSNEAARAEAAGLLRPLYEVENAGEKLLAVLEIQAASKEDPVERLEIVATAVEVADKNLNDPKRAFALAARGLEEAAGSDDVRAWIERVERLAAASGGEWAELAALLKKVEPEIVDGEVKLEVTLRVAELARTKLDDRATARTYYVRALDLQGDEPRALEALEQLYEQDEDWPALLDILKRRAEVATDREQKVALLTKQAKVCEGRLNDPQGAIEALEAIVEDDRPPFEALAALERLYGQVERWLDVLGLLERQLGMANDASAGSEWRSDVTLHHAIGVLARTRLADVDRALEEFRTTLTLDPAHQPTIDELEGMLEDPELRARAAEILEPVYLARVDWRKVMHTLEVRLLDAQDPDERRSLLNRIAGMHEDEGQDLGAALATYARLLREDPTNEETWKELERVAKAGGLQKELLATYERELEAVDGDEATAARLAFRAGEIAEQLGDAQRALGLYRRAHSVEPSGRATFEAIDRLLKPLGLADDRIALYREALDHRFDDAERIALLRTIAELHRDARNDVDAAIEAFRQLLDVDDRDAAALDALEELYAKSERHRDLADLLERRADSEESPEKACAFRLRLGKVLDEKLEDPNAAIDCYEQIVQINPSHRGAIDALEAMLERRDLKARVAEILRPLYEGADDWRRLVDLGEERLALVEDVGERTSILRETARLWEERGQDKPKAFAAIRRAWEIDPEDQTLRAEADRLAEALGDWDGLVEAYERAAAAVDEISRPDLLRGLAELHDRRRDDPRASLATLERLHALDPEDFTVLDRMDRFATLLGDWPALDRVLEKKAETTGDPTEQASTWRRVGALRRDMLEDAERAIAAYERALDIEAESHESLDALIALYEAREGDEAASKLIDLYQRRVDVTPSGGEGDDLRYDLLMRRARVAESGTQDPREAISSLQAALAIRAGDPAAAKALERLYESEKMWLELMEAMRLRAATVETTEERVSLRKRIATLQARELDDKSGALDVWRLVLDEAPSDEDAIAAVRAIGESDESLRLVAAEILEPVLRAGARHDDLAAVLEMRLQGEQDPFDRSKTLQAIARVHEEGRKDPKAAREALLRAFEETPDDRVVRDDLERLASAEGGDDGFRAVADAFEKKAESSYDTELVRELLVSVARICEERLKDDARAAKALAKAAEQSGDLPELLEGLDRLYGRLGRNEDLADVLGRRIEIATDPGARADLRARLAGVQIRAFDRKREGLATLRSALEEVPDHAGSRDELEGLLDDPELFEEAAEALEPVYRAANDHAKLAALFERRIDRAPSRDRTRLRLDLARVLEERANDPKAAQRQVERALRDDPTESEPMIELERLLPITGEWREAADVLAAVAASDEVSSDLSRDLWSKVATWRKERLGDDAGAEQAWERALEKDPENVEILRTIEGLQRDAGRERELVATLRRRASLEGSLEEKRTLLREAHGLAKGFEEHDLAEAILRELLKDDEANAWALEQLTAARAAAKDWNEVYALLLRRAELASDASEQTALRHEAARVAKVERKDEAQAIELYRELLDASDGGASDEVAIRELRELYASTKRFGDLGELLVRLIDHATSAGERSRLRLELAALQRTELARPEDAIETLRAVVDEEPSNTDAVLALGELYESLGRNEDLAELLTRQIDRAKDAGDVSQELSLRVRLGELYAKQLSDPKRAIETYEAVLEREPGHQGALTALEAIHEQRGDREKQAEVLAKIVDVAQGAEGAGLALKLAGLRAELKDDQGREKALRRALDLAEAASDGELAAKARKELRALYAKTEAWSDLAAILVTEADLEQDTQAKVSHLREAAQIHLEKRQAPAEAAALLEKATALVPDDRPLLLLLCDALSGSGRGKEAADVLRKVIESFGGRRSKELALYHHRLAHALQAQGEREEALREYDLAFKIDPGNVLVLRDLGKLALDVGDLERAQKTFRALLLQKLDASSGITKGEVFYHLGEISARQGDKAKALQMFDRALETDPSLTKAKDRAAELKASGVAGPSVRPPPASAPKSDAKPEEST